MKTDLKVAASIYMDLRLYLVRGTDAVLGRIVNGRPEYGRHAAMLRGYIKCELNIICDRYHSDAIICKPSMGWCGNYTYTQVSCVPLVRSLRLPPRYVPEALGIVS